MYTESVTRYARNTSAVFSLKFHLVWCPKFRRSVLAGPVAKRLRELLEQKARELEATIRALEVMPDHVHALVQPLPKENGAHDLAELVHSVKGYSSHRINQLRGRNGPVWQDERFDRWVRHEEEFAEEVEIHHGQPGHGRIGGGGSSLPLVVLVA